VLERLLQVTHLVHGTDCSTGWVVTSYHVLKFRSMVSGAEAEGGAR
jgi:hypothetical protein